MVQETDIAVIGSGPGGYVAAIRASQLGKKVTIIEKESVGGICLNVGCIPSKALITAGDKYHDIENYKYFGLTVPEISADFKQVQEYKSDVVNQLTNGVKTLLKGNKVNVVYGTATFKDKHSLEVVSEDGNKEEIRFQDAIIATGSRPKEISALPFSKRILDSTGVLELPKIPESMIVVGGGVIGVELASAYANFGTKITIVEGLENILPTINPKLSNEVKKQLKQKGADIYTKAVVKGSHLTDKGVEVETVINGEKEVFEAEYVLVSIGRTPNSNDLKLNNIEIDITDEGLIKKDQQNRTTTDNIYAIGDVTKGVQLAHRASYEAKVAAEAIAGMKTVNDYYAMPSVVFSDPEVATVGENEEQLQEKGIDFIAKRFPFGGNGRAIALQQKSGFINLIAERSTGKILGCEIVGPNASDLINEITLAMEANLTVQDIALTIHPHPTLGEVVMEVAEYIDGTPIHTM